MNAQTPIVLGVVVVVLILIGVYVFWRRSRGATPVEPIRRLYKTVGVLGAALGGPWDSGLDDSDWAEISEVLLAADVGVEASTRIVRGLRSAKPESPDDARGHLARLLRSELNDAPRMLRLDGEPSIVVIVGVNGTGKTTTVAKLSHRLKEEGKSVIIGAADTFRAAAGEQLEIWARRVGVDIVTGQEGGDPAAVVFDTISAAKGRHADIVIIDTAGRLHGKKNLMGELKKIYKVAAGDGEVDEVLLVLDATAGQNGLAQVREFVETIPVSGIVLTKLDGTAKGGIVIAVEKELGIPVKFIGLGEGLDDMEPFDPDSFISALLEES
jgi:fused signal recognition particle receptor